MKKKAKKKVKAYDKAFVYMLECGDDETGWYVPVNDEGEKRAFTCDAAGLKEAEAVVLQERICGIRDCPCPIHDEESLTDNWRIAKYQRVEVVGAKHGKR